MECSGYFIPGLHGVIYPIGTVPGKPSTVGFCAGAEAGSGIGSSRRSSESWMRPARSIGSSSALTAVASAHTRPQQAPGKKPRAGEPADHALGRSRGGWGSKLHLVGDGKGLGLTLELSAGQENECPHATSVLDGVRITRLRGRPRQRPAAVAGDKGYSSRAIRAWLRAKKVRVKAGLELDGFTGLDFDTPAGVGGWSGWSHGEGSCRGLEGSVRPALRRWRGR